MQGNNRRKAPESGDTDHEEVASDKDEGRKNPHLVAYDDVEGLFVNVGVVAALMLSLAVGVFQSLRPEDFFLVQCEEWWGQLQDYRGDFVGPYLVANGMNLDLPLGIPPLNMHAYLNSSASNFLTTEDLYKRSDGNHDLNVRYVNLIFAWLAKQDLLEAFRYDDMSFRAHRYWNTDGINDQLQPAIRAGHFCISLLFLSLLISVLFYTSMCLVGARKHQERFNKWYEYGFYSVIVSYVFFIVGIGLFFYVITATFFYQFHPREMGFDMKEYNMFGLFIPVFLLASFSVFVLTYHTAKPAEMVGSKENDEITLNFGNEELEQN